MQDEAELARGVVERLTQELHELNQARIESEIKVLTARSELIAPVLQAGVDRFLQCHFEMVRLGAIISTLSATDDPDGLEHWASPQQKARDTIEAPLKEAKAAARDAFVSGGERSRIDFELKKSTGEEVAQCLEALLGDENAPLPEI